MNNNPERLSKVVSKCLSFQHAAKMAHIAAVKNVAAGELEHAAEMQRFAADNAREAMIRLAFLLDRRMGHFPARPSNHKDIVESHD